MGPQTPGIRISPDQLTPDTLRNVIEEFVTRDGTDLVDAETKIGTVEDLLRRGEVEIWYDAATRSCNILVAVPGTRRGGLRKGAEPPATA